MSTPQTMFALTGRTHAAASLGNATLLVIDAQEEYRSGVLKLPGLDAAVSEIAKLLATARERGTPIVHIKHLGIPDGLLDPRGPRGKHLPEVAPLPGERILEKRLPNAFSGTELHEHLQSLGNLDLIICGFMTHSSISSTVRATKDYGYRCTVVDAACATRDLPTMDGQVISAADMHRTQMIALADNFAVVVPNASALR
ncbi:cysteine hydrolase family protein [Pseudomonas sp. 5P_3.1_Bac2]|uniref:cysteine hydrolase family protein n=1 Tax=Pseudomonas sp. 5P_3.1_Bac2 TaxID=2971617 RepID=UPI0021C74A8C|nr:cysteine hydrolase family protein [Pseudomonas sp. 5P_3.1_Bac2]MCU1716201.1 cysteine hydrolase [Pseudomonas sp. 5P_3.1_Bac2]